MRSARHVYFFLEATSAFAATVAFSIVALSPSSRQRIVSDDDPAALAEHLQRAGAVPDHGAVIFVDVVDAPIGNRVFDLAQLVLVVAIDDQALTGTIGSATTRPASATLALALLTILARLMSNSFSLADRPSATSSPAWERA